MQLFTNYVFFGFCLISILMTFLHVREYIIAKFKLIANKETIFPKQVYRLTGWVAIHIHDECPNHNEADDIVYETEDSPPEGSGQLGVNIVLSYQHCNQPH